MIFFAIYELSFRSVKQKCNFYFFNYDIFEILVDSCVWIIYDFGWFFATQIREAEMNRIHRKFGHFPVKTKLKIK